MMDLQTLLTEARDNLRYSLSEMNLMYESSKGDWNSNTRQAVAKDIAELIEPLMLLEDFMIALEEEQLINIGFMSVHNHTGDGQQGRDRFRVHILFAVI